MQRYRYDAFGALLASPGTVTQPYTFTAREFDPETGLYYYRARAYDPTTGRFLQEDPIGFDGGDTNLYGYVLNDPVNLSDPLGLTWKTNLAFLWDFFTGRGNTSRTYGPHDVQTQEIRNSIAAQKMRDAFRRSGCRDIRNFAYGTYEAAWDTLLNPLTADWSSTSAQAGGFAGASVINNGDGTVTVTIPNVAGSKSFFYHLAHDRKGTTGPFRSIRQMIQWTENIDTCRC